MGVFSEVLGDKYASYSYGMFLYKLTPSIGDSFTIKDLMKNEYLDKELLSETLEEMIEDGAIAENDGVYTRIK